MTALEDVLVDLLGRRIDIDGIPDVYLHSTVLEVRRMASRKNQVHLLRTSGGDVVLKVFNNDRWEREHSTLVLCRSKGVLVPKPLLSGEGYILMEYLEGPDLRDLINDTLDPTYIRALAEWLAAFHLATEDDSLVRSDAKLQNFILTGRGVAGLDFELAHPGDRVEDLGEICAHLLNTDPMFVREKYELCHEFLECYVQASGRSTEGISGWTARAMEEAAHFRPHQRETLLREADKLRTSEVWPFDEGQNR